MLYCARSDVYAIGLPAEAFARPPRAVEGVTPSTGTFALRSHGFSLDAPISLAVISSSTLGAPAAVLPVGLSIAVPYFARPNGSDLFALAAAVSPAAPIASFGDAGSGLFAVIVDHGVYLDAAILMASRIVDDFARAHHGNINAAILPLVCAFLAGRIYVATHRALMPEHKSGEADAPSWVLRLVDQLFNLWLSGVDIKGATDDTPQAETGPIAVRLKGRGFLRGEREDIV